MPPVTILSPYSGRPVKVRDQDMGRALRDEQGRVFYIVEDPEQGRYAARTRKGSAKDLERYQKLVAGELEMDQHKQAVAQAHDATGAKRRNPVGLLVLLVIVLLLAVGAYVLLINPGLIGMGESDTQNEPADEAPQPSGHRWPVNGLQIIHANNANKSAKPYADFHHTASGLRYKITHRTTGPRAQAGNVVTVRYAMQSLDGRSLIDDADQSFVLMSGEAIRAFDEGLAGLREGEQLRLLVPRGHSVNGTLPGIERLPDEPFILDVQLVTVRTGVTWIVEQPGRPGETPAGPGDIVKIHYVLRVEGQDEVIDATAMRGEPMSITLGKGEVIRGLELGLIGMRPGETRMMTIPPYLAYGDREIAGGMIPANAVLSFRVMLVSAKPPEKATETDI